jgi:hypothetical protein
MTPTREAFVRILISQLGQSIREIYMEVPGPPTRGVLHTTQLDLATKMLKRQAARHTTATAQSPDYFAKPVDHVANA